MSEVSSQNMREWANKAEDEAPSAILDRGIDLLTRGGVRDPSIIQEEGRATLQAMVDGSWGTSYEVTLNLKEGFEKGTCCCEFRANINERVPCKHMTALALWAGSEGATIKEAEELWAETGSSPRRLGRKI